MKRFDRIPMKRSSSMGDSLLIGRRERKGEEDNKKRRQGKNKKFDIKKEKETNILETKGCMNVSNF